MINPAFNTKGKACPLIFGEPCPGTNIMEGGGCPHWRVQTVEFHDAPEETWIGCGILMDPNLLTGLGKGVQRAAKAVQGTRNAVAGTMLGLAKTMSFKLNEIEEGIKSADEATFRGENLLELKSESEENSYLIERDENMPMLENGKEKLRRE